VKQSSPQRKKESPSRSKLSNNIVSKPDLVPNVAEEDDYDPEFEYYDEEEN
jgi:hypothetical protein